MLRRAAAPLVLVPVARRMRGRRRRVDGVLQGHAVDRAGAEADPPQPGQRVDDAHDRVEELHRGVHPRRDLRAGAEGRAATRSRKQLDYGSELVAFKGVRDGKLDAYPEYTGTALTTFFDVEPNEIPKDEQEAYEAGQGRLRQERGDRAPADARSPTPTRVGDDARARGGKGHRDDCDL